MKKFFSILLTLFIPLSFVFSLARAHTAVMISYLNQVTWNEQGLISAITADATPDKLLMQARLSREAPATAVAEKRAGYWSRSRAKLWRKGGRFGNAQRLLEIKLDGEADQRHRPHHGRDILLPSVTGK